MNKPPKPKKCKECGELFTPQRSFQVTCSVACAIACAKKKQAIKQEKAQRVKNAFDKEKLLTHKDWLNLLQVVFNTWIRQRDGEFGCITCGVKSGVQFHCGHFFSQGGNPNLRFNPDNCHKQCSRCNNNLHGNLIEYAEQLPKRIGQERFEALKLARNVPLKLTIPEIKQLIVEYKQKIKELK